ncbi:MAG: 7-cyano-7-deazaguanine synthase [Pseudomonadota bacterium]
MNELPQHQRIPDKAIDVVEKGRRPRKDKESFEFGRDFSFSTAALESYAFARWEEVIFDAMVVAAAIEYADRIVKRPPRGWPRQLSVRIPVHDPDRWNAPGIISSLHDAIGFLTGDYWSISFVKRHSRAPAPPLDYLNLSMPTEAVLAFSDGMDSLAVAGLMERDLDGKLVLVRVSKKKPTRKSKGQPFTAVPYDVSCDMPNRETSARSRGFKFAMISGIAAYLTNAGKVLLPESGQGIFGPVLVAVSHGYPDYRNHPLFTSKMQRFLKVLLKKDIQYDFPQLWSTKGQSLAAFAAIDKDEEWKKTRSCWRNNQWASIGGTRRQCGACAACMLRRVSVHAAGLEEDAGTYICTDMSAETLEAAVDPKFTRMSPAFRAYAVAGVLHMDHFADLAEEDGKPIIRRHAKLVAPAIGRSVEDTERQLAGLVSRHREEWKSFMSSLGARSFIRQWSRIEK